MKQKIFLIILALLILLPSCKSPSSPDTDGVTTTGTISGTVTDASSSTVTDASISTVTIASTANPIAGASVSTQPATTTVTTDAQGNYTISDVAPGFYTVTASASGYFAGNAGVTVTAGQTATCNLALQPEPTTGTISGTVTDMSTGNPIAGASVSTQPATTTVTTDAQGNYAISDVEQGYYTVTASASGYFDESANITVTAGQTTTCNLELQPTTGTISGTVTDAGTAMPLAGASVSTQPATTTVITDAQGDYTISDVTPGFYTVTASASGYMDNSTNVTVTAGQTSTAYLALQADYSGSWNGTTTQGKTISFTIVNNAFTQFKFGWRISIPGCTVNGTTTITYSTPRAFSGNTFTISGTSYQMSYSFSGTFNSKTTASGNGIVTYTGGCPGSTNFTWSANKN